MSASAPSPLSTRLLPPAQPMLSRDIPDGPRQEITADYLIHKGKGYLLVCDLFSKYSLYRVSTKSAQSLCTYLQQLIFQYGLPSLLFNDNGLPLKFEDQSQFLQHNHRPHHLFPHFPRSNGFTEPQVRTLRPCSVPSELKKDHRRHASRPLVNTYWVQHDFILRDPA